MDLFGERFSIFMSLKFFLILSFSLLSLSRTASAAVACRFADPANRIPVVFFGGNAATDDQTLSWRSAADTARGSTFDFDKNSSYNINMTQSKIGPVTESAQASINNCVSKINDPTFKGPAVLIGHSDGSWIIDNIAKQLTPEAKKKVRVISLDGNYDPGAPFGIADYECWTAYDADIQSTAPRSCSEIRPAAASWFTKEMKKCRSPSGADLCHMMPVYGCSGNVACLHFRLINSNASDKIAKSAGGDSGYGRIGYSQVSPQFPYLEGLSASSIGRQPVPTSIRAGAQ